jgi:hypothetical protein
MSNWIDYELDLLAQSSEELERVITRLQQPSAELVNWVERQQRAVRAVHVPKTDFDEQCTLTLEPPKADHPRITSLAEQLKELVQFEMVERFHSQGITKSCRLKIARRDHSAGILRGHLFEVSAEFPDAILLLFNYDMQASYAEKMVIKEGEVFQQIHDGRQQAQAMDWVLIDIFAPFKTEFELGIEFGSMLQQWLADLAVAVKELNHVPEGENSTAA